MIEAAGCFVLVEEARWLRFCHKVCFKVFLEQNVGRWIECKINGQRENVWKYVFGLQPSEMYRIYEELEIGEYHPVRFVYSQGFSQRTYEYLKTRREADADILILNRGNIEEINEWIEVLKEVRLCGRDKWLAPMMEAIRDFMIKYPEQEEFVFEG